jgi:hypothetical protein
MATEITYGTQVDLTITLAGLASDTNLLAGRESTAVGNSTVKAGSYQIAGQITTGTSPTTARVIEVWMYGEINDTPTYPGVLDGTDSNETIIAANKGAALKLIAVIDTVATSDQAYPFGPVTVHDVPESFGVFVVHNTGVNLNATGGNHFITATPIKYATV